MVQMYYDSDANLELLAGKTEVRVYDYVDSYVPVLARMFEKRKKGYEALGYEV